MDWIPSWKHNGYWFFDSPEIIQALVQTEGVSIEDLSLFYYQAYHLQWDEFGDFWEPFEPEPAFDTSVTKPVNAIRQGFDIVSFSCGNAAECSPLTCNHMAQEIPVNAQGLLDSLGEAKSILEARLFKGCEPGPYRIFEVFTVP